MRSPSTAPGCRCHHKGRADSRGRDRAARRYGCPCRSASRRGGIFDGAKYACLWSRRPYRDAAGAAKYLAETRNFDGTAVSSFSPPGQGGDHDDRGRAGRALGIQTPWHTICPAIRRAVSPFAKVCMMAVRPVRHRGHRQGAVTPNRMRPWIRRLFRRRSSSPWQSIVSRTSIRCKAGGVGLCDRPIRRRIP